MNTLLWIALGFAVVVIIVLLVMICALARIVFGFMDGWK